MQETMSKTTQPVVSDFTSNEFVGRMRALRNALTAGLVEREDAVRLGLLAMLAGEHVLMLGPPGTAKSLVARRLHLGVEKSRYFERLLTRFTVPEELFGPLSIKGLEEDRYERLTEGYLPKASIAFLDEIFKANSAILNALLTLLNEREFDNGACREKTPLMSVVGASNELPKGEELDALYDRFLLRLHVGPVTKAAFRGLLALRGDAEPVVEEAAVLRSSDLDAVRKWAEVVTVPDDVVALLCDLREWCAAEGLRVSDRRWRKVVKLLQVSAATNGRRSVSIWDCWMLQHCLWDVPERREQIHDWYSKRVGVSAAMDPSRLTTVVTAFEGQLEKDRKGQTQRQDRAGRLLYVDGNGGFTADKTADRQKLRGQEPLFLAPPKSFDRQLGHLSDRTNQGRGYTTDELERLQVQNVGGYSHSYVQYSHWSERATYVADPANRIMETVELAPAMEQNRHDAHAIEKRIEDLQKVQVEVEVYREKLIKQIHSLESEIKAHLWIAPEIAGPAGKNLVTTKRAVDGLGARVDKLIDGFKALPRKDSPSDHIDVLGAGSGHWEAS